MRREFATVVTGWFFILASAMGWGGWVLMPHQIGVFFEPADFVAIHPRLTVWLWMYRVHLFGMIATVLALTALGALLADSPARILVWPGVAVASAGLIVGAVGAAFYYHFGVWGSLEMNGKSADVVDRFVDSLRVATEYVTCLVRFGRVFSGLGLFVLACGLLKWRLMPTWIAGGAAILGLSGMGLTMGFPNHLAWYQPVFHLNAVWLAAAGFMILRNGIRLETSREEKR